MAGCSVQIRVRSKPEMQVTGKTFSGSETGREGEGSDERKGSQPRASQSARFARP